MGNKHHKKHQDKHHHHHNHQHQPVDPASNKAVEEPKLTIQKEVAPPPSKKCLEYDYNYLKDEVIIVVPEIMSYSRHQSKLKALKEVPPKMKFEQVVTAAVMKAFNITSETTARNYYATVHDIASGNFHQSAVGLSHSLSHHDREILHLSLHNILNTESPDGIQIALALIHRGYSECTARKQFVLSSLLDSTHVLDFEEKTISLLQNAQEPWRRQLLSHLIDFLDGIKEKAFKTVFTEPSKLYFNLINDTTAEGDVDVHGANVYLGLLKVCLGVNLRRTPFMEDEAKGCADYLEGFGGKTSEFVSQMWADTNLGRSFEGVFSWEQLKTVGTSSLKRIPNRFIFDGYLVSDVVKEVGRCYGVGDKTRLSRLFPYLEKYAYFFSEDYIVEAMYRTLSLEDQLVNAMNEAFHSMGENEEEEDVRYWLWDMEADPPVFRKENAKLLFRYLGVIH